jgi:Mg2+-importing ATPase
MAIGQTPDRFWSIPAERLLSLLKTSPAGLSNQEVEDRLKVFGPNRLKPQKKYGTMDIFLSQFKSPIVIILIAAAVLSYFLHDPTDSLIILAIVMITAILGFWQEKGATNAVKKLLAIVTVRARILRDGNVSEVPFEEVVPGDIVELSAGRAIPGDCLILEAKDLFVNEATLTGETYPVEKSPGVVDADAPLSGRTNVLFTGSFVVSGTARAVVVSVAGKTELGKISGRLALKAPETQFEHGVKHFGFFLMEITLILVIAIFAINVFLKRPVLESFLFSVALAVGLTPQLLPAIITINLSYGAGHMAKKKVILKRLSAIEDFGSMNVLCSDKTGTLTEGVVKIHSGRDALGNDSDHVLYLAYLNARFESGFLNPIDEAIRTFREFDLAGIEKHDEIPYDFTRKRLSISIIKDGRCLLITKGAVLNVRAVCDYVRKSDGSAAEIGPAQDEIQRKYEELSAQGFRTLAIATKELKTAVPITKGDETGMTFEGFIVLFDPPKKDVGGVISRLTEIGVGLKIITGDNALVAAQVAKEVGLPGGRIVTGKEISGMSDEALGSRAGDTNVFAEIEPNQKERIIRALRKSGNVVGYMGDGINDATALHAADVAISVDTAVDVAKESADIVLLEKDLGVLLDGIREGRNTFANTMKYVFMSTSANFGNMFSMAGVSLFLTFLPLLPKQILLTNLLTDFPEMTIASDHVDDEMVRQPRRWDIKFIRNFMMVFGPLSSVFDFITFGVLLFVLHASPAEFRTGWFVESVVSAAMVVLVIRTRRPFFLSMPSRLLFLVTIVIAGLTVLFPFTALGRLFGFVALPLPFLGILAAIVFVYIIGAEITKRIFFHRAG